MKSEVFKQKLKHELTEYAVNAAYLALSLIHISEPTRPY